jgi:hypothetical protein
MVDALLGGPLKPVFGLSGAIQLSPVAHSNPLLPERNLQCGAFPQTVGSFEC